MSLNETTSSSANGSMAKSSIGLSGVSIPQHFHVVMSGVHGLRLGAYQARDVVGQALAQRLLVRLARVVFVMFERLQDGPIVAAKGALHIEGGALDHALDAALARRLPFSMAF